MTANWHISSLVVTADPARIGTVTGAIAAIPAAEIALSDPSGKLIVTLETPGETEMVRALTDIQLLPGVASAALVYHHADEGPAEPDPGAAEDERAASC